MVAPTNQQDIHKRQPNYQAIADRVAKFLSCESFPLHNKQPVEVAPNKIYAWKMRSKSVPGIQTDNLSLWASATGYGLAPILRSGGIWIDVDDPVIIPELFALIPGLSKTFADVRGDRPHYFVIAPDDLPKATITLERDSEQLGSLRGNGADGRRSYVAGPGSQHLESGTKRKLTNNSVPIHLTTEEYAALLTFFQRPTIRNSTPAHKTTPYGNYTLDTQDKRQRAYLRAAIQGELALIRNAVEGRRNTQLNASAFNLFRFCKSGVLDESEFLPDLIESAMSTGLKQREIERTIASARNSAEPAVLNSAVWPASISSALTSKKGSPAQVICNPTCLSEISIPIEAKKCADSLPDNWPNDLPAVIDRLWFATGLASSAIILFGAVLRAIASGVLDPANLTRKSIAQATSLTERQVRNGLDKGDGIFFSVVGANSATCRLSAEMTENIQASHEDEFGSSIVSNAESPSAAKEAHRPAQVYSLNSPSVTVQKILDRIVIPQAKMRQYPNRSTNRFAPPDPELIQAAGLDLADLQSLSDNLIYPSGNAAAEAAVEAKVTEWRKQLTDLTPLALPALPAGLPITNGKRLRAAKVLAAALPHTEGRISLKELARAVGASESTIQRTLVFAGVGMKENVEFVTVKGRLPQPGYDFTMQGAPFMARCIDANGEYTQNIPYSVGRDESGRDVINPVLERLAATGRPIQIGYRLAGTPYKMSVEERQQALAKGTAGHRASKSAQPHEDSIVPTKLSRCCTSVPHDTTGYRIAYALAWRARINDYLPLAFRGQFVE